MEQQKLKNIIEAVLMSAEKPMKVNQIEALFAGDVDMPARNDIRKALQDLAEDYKDRGFELKEVASGFRIQVGQDYADWVGRLWEEKPARYTRALLETLALIAYRQPITRGEIEEVRGVSVSSNIIKTLQEREWIKVLGHKDVPGKPALYGTSKEFLDYFNLKSLEDLPTLAELKDLDQIHQELDLDIDSTAEQQGQQPDEIPKDEQQAGEQPPHDDDQPPEDALQSGTEAGSDASDEAGTSESVDTEADVVVAQNTEEAAADKADAPSADDDGSSEQGHDDEQANSGDAEVISINAADNDVEEDAVDEEEVQPQSVAS